jgi:hypothetical protein
MTKEDWADYCPYVKNTENSYWENDAIMENVTENFKVNLGKVTVVLVTVTAVVIPKL